jgi:hypothetical protein
MTPRLTSAPLAALLAIAGLLSGCGGGADSQSAAQTQVVVAGIAIDGVLKSAQVFLDLNDNGSLDAGEPTTLTDSNGAFTLMATPAQKAAHSVVVVAIAGQTVDQDSPGVAVTKGFTLMAPPGKPELVSPITTSVMAKVKAGQTLPQAEDAVRADLGMPGIDVYANYVSAKATNATYQELHNLAAAMVEVFKNVETSDPKSTLTQKLASFRTSVDAEVLGRLAAIKAAPSIAAARSVVNDSVSVSTLRLYAAAAQLTSLVDLEANTVTLNWVDSFPSGTRYDIKTQNPDDSYTTVESLAGAGGSNSKLSWSRALTTDKKYRIDARIAADTLTLQTPQKQTTVTGLAPGAAPEIVVSGDEPASGTVQLSIGNGLTYPSVNWYADLRLIGTSTTGAGNPVSWNTSTETNSAHLIVARIQVASDSYTEVRKVISVANSNLALAAQASGTTGTINVDVSASSQYGIARVEAAFDGTPQASLTEPNASSGRFTSSFNVYRFSVNAAQAGSGSHTMVVTAVDKQGARKSVTVAVPITNLPLITLTSPADGALVSGTLSLTGTSSSDRPGAVTTTASLGDYPFLTTTNANFTGTMSLANLPAGSYTLTVKATDSSKSVTVLQRTVTVTSSSALAFQPNFTLGAGGQLIKLDNSNPALLLYRATDGSYRVRNTTTQTEVTLQGVDAIRHLYNWEMEGGNVFISSLGTTGIGSNDCVNSCIFMWDTTGKRTNLSNANTYLGIYEQYPRAHGNDVIWINAAGSNPGSFTRYNTATKTFSKITQPAGANYLINTEYDFAVDANGNIAFFYGAQTGGEGVSSTFDVYRWNSATNSSTKLSSGGARSIYPKTDGQRVVWQQTTPGNTSGPFTLLAQAASGGAITTLSSNAGNFQLRDGLAAWTESTTTVTTGRFPGTTNTVTGLKASTSDNRVYELSQLASVNLYAVSGGSVIFGEAGKVYSWNATTQRSTLLLETAPTQLMAVGKTLYFVMGTTQVVYKIAID